MPLRQQLPSHQSYHVRSAEWTQSWIEQVMRQELSIFSRVTLIRIIRLLGKIQLTNLGMLYVRFATISSFPFFVDLLQDHEKRLRHNQMN
jgi:hypothetical protein